MKDALQAAFNEFWEAGVKSDFYMHALTVHHYPDANRDDPAFRIVGGLVAENLLGQDDKGGYQVKDALIKAANELELEVPSEN